MLDIPGTCVDLTSAEAETVKKSNEEYEMVCVLIIVRMYMHGKHDVPVASGEPHWE